MGSGVSLVWGWCFHGDLAGGRGASCRCTRDARAPLCDKSGLRRCGAHRETLRSARGPRTTSAWPSAPWWSPAGPGSSPSAGRGSPWGEGWWLWPPRLSPTSQQGEHFGGPARWAPLALRPDLLLESRPGLHRQGRGSTQSAGGPRAHRQRPKWQMQERRGVEGGARRSDEEPGLESERGSCRPFTQSPGRLRSLASLQNVCRPDGVEAELLSRGHQGARRRAQIFIQQASAYLPGTNTSRLISSVLLTWRCLNPFRVINRWKRRLKGSERASEGFMVPLRPGKVSFSTWQTRDEAAQPRWPPADHSGCLCRHHHHHHHPPRFINSTSTKKTGVLANLVLELVGATSLSPTLARLRGRTDGGATDPRHTQSPHFSPDFIASHTWLN